MRSEDSYPVVLNVVDREWLRPMPSDAATAIAYVGAFVGLTGGGVALFNSWKATLETG